MILVVNLKSLFQKYRTLVRNKLPYLSIFSLLGLFSACSFAQIQENAFGFTTTRIIYIENGNKGVPVSFVNNTRDSLLIMPDIYNADENGNKSDVRSNAFVVSPVFRRAQPFSENAMKVVRTGGHLPDDTESLFYLSSVLLPNKRKSPQDQIAVNVGYMWNMKILYRPLGLKGIKIKDSIDSLVFFRDGKRIKLTNNSPLWQTIIDLKINGKKINGPSTMMLRPHSSALLDISEHHITSASFQVIDEAGHHIPAGGKTVIF